MTPLQTISLNAANALFASTSEGLLLVLAVALCLRLLPSIPAAGRSLVWTVVFALILALPFLPTPHNSAHTLAINPLWTLPVAAIWLTLSLFRATQLLLSARALRRLALTSTPVRNPDPSFLLCTSPLVCISDQVDRPTVVGFFSRRILLPATLYASLTPSELHHVLLHESEHLRRRDDWTNLLQKLALVALPLNPVLLWVERRLCLERELACDDRVLRATGTPKAYATCLTHLAEHSLLHRSLTLALGFFERQSELTRRVHRILLTPHTAISPRRASAATATLLIALTGGSLTLAHAPQFVRFAAPSTQSASLDPLPTIASKATFQSTAFHTSSSDAKPTFVKAIMPLPAKPHPVRRLKRTLSHPRPSAPHALQANWAYDGPPTSQRMVLTTAAGDRVSYTFISTVAVATPHGWIIFQL